MASSFGVVIYDSVGPFERTLSTAIYGSVIGSAFPVGFNASVIAKSALAFASATSYFVGILVSGFFTLISTISGFSAFLAPAASFGHGIGGSGPGVNDGLPFVRRFLGFGVSSHPCMAESYTDLPI